MNPLDAVLQVPGRQEEGTEEGRTGTQKDLSQAGSQAKLLKQTKRAQSCLLSIHGGPGTKLRWQGGFQLIIVSC